MKTQINDQPADYQIKVLGRLDENWAEWFDGLAISAVRDVQGNTVTTLAGPVADQVALHALLDRISDLGLALLSVERLDPSSPESSI